MRVMAGRLAWAVPLATATFVLGWWVGRTFTGADEQERDGAADVVPAERARTAGPDGRLLHPTLRGTAPGPKLEAVPTETTAPPATARDGYEEVQGRTEWEWLRSGADPAPFTLSTGEPFPLLGDGVVRITAADGTSVLEAEFKAGTLDGPWRAWHADGRRATEGQYEAGRKNGTWRTFHPNGERATEETYGPGGLEGVVRSWLPDGTLVEETAYERGQRHGPHRRWHADGRSLAEEGRFAAGVRDGRWTWYDPRGRVVREEDWKEGALQGPVRLSGALPGALPDAEALVKAGVDGKYASLLRRIAAPDDRGGYKDFHDYGAYPATDYLGERQVPAGHWVYVYPYWYVWGEARAAGR